MSRARLTRGAVYVLSFGIGRGALFTAPLVLANLLSARDYGHLETAQAAASLSASIAALGTASVVPLVLLGHNKQLRFGSIVGHHLAIALACVLVALATAAGGAPFEWTLAALFTAAVTLQSLASTHLRTLGRGDASVLLDAGLFGSMALAALAARLVHAPGPMAWVVTAACAYALALGAVYLRTLRREPAAAPGTVFALWRLALLSGMPLMLGGVVSLLATTSGRLGMGLLAGAVATAQYAVLARAGALPIVAHQLFMIGSFRNLFTLADAQVERAAARIVALVAASALGFIVLVPWIGPLIGPAFVDAFTRYRLPGLWIVAQSVLWSAIALNDLVIARKQVMARILPATAGFLAIALLLGWLLLKTLGADLPHFVYTHGVVMLLFYVAQSMAMRANGIHMWRVWITAVSSTLGLIALAESLPAIGLVNR